MVAVMVTTLSFYILIFLAGREVTQVEKLLASKCKVRVLNTNIKLDINFSVKILGVVDQKDLNLKVYIITHRYSGLLISKFAL